MSRRAFILAGLGLALGACAIRIPLGGSLADIAERDEGKTARQLGLPESLWCADYLNLIRREAGMRTVPSRRAIDQAKAGRRVSYPVRGDIVITTRGRWGHHCDVLQAIHKDGTMRVIGGNVGGRVASRTIPIGGAIFVRPE